MRSWLTERGFGSSEAACRLSVGSKLCAPMKSEGEGKEPRRDGLRSAKPYFRSHLAGLKVSRSFARSEVQLFRSLFRTARIWRRASANLVRGCEGVRGRVTIGGLCAPSGENDHVTERTSSV